MKCAVFHGLQDVRVEEYPRPVIADDEILIQVKYCGICGTDVHIFHGDKGAAETTPPRILGHEFSGIIVEAGSAVRDVKVGDRVITSKYAGTEVKCDGKEYNIVRQGDILAVVE